MSKSPIDPVKLDKLAEVAIKVGPATKIHFQIDVVPASDSALNIDLRQMLNQRRPDNGIRTSRDGLNRRRLTQLPRAFEPGADRIDLNNLLARQRFVALLSHVIMVLFEEWTQNPTRILSHRAGVCRALTCEVDRSHRFSFRM